MTTNYQAALILADAFLHYPLMRFAFGDDEAKRSTMLSRLFNKTVVATSLYGGVIISEDGRAAITWLPGKAFPLTLMNELRAGMLAIPLQVGVKSTLRLMNHDTVPESWIRKHASEDMGYIWCIGVEAAQRGKGHSRLLINLSL
jgi:hypothetical protein